MRKFWGYSSNENYAVGCSGSTVYVYDKEGKELAKFKDIKHGYTSKFCPNKNIFVVKSSDAYLAVYSLDTLSLLQTLRFSNVQYSQDDGYCFSIDGKYFYNIERQKSSVHSVISVYDTDNFKRINMFLDDDEYTEPKWIEYDKTGQLFVLGFLRGETKIISDGFISKFGNNGLESLYKIPSKEYDYYHTFKCIEESGFTEKQKEVYSIKYSKEEFDEMIKKKLPLSGLWNKYNG